ncbi:hypothetical protein EIP86_008061 [Pleurotus ostreatoroseus]|nr:hypothetical protein EIP86_008061 [Pleurotus ostreatoroseus]
MSDSEQDDDVQVLGESSNSIKCEICGKNLQNLTTELRQKHYDTSHAEEADSTPSITADTRNLLLRPILKRKWNGFSENDAFWHPSEATDPPPNFTPGTYDYNVRFSLPRTPSGLIPLLKKALIKAHEKGNVQKAYLCCPNAVHVAIEPWDRKWGCGYRNFEMACASLMEDPRQPAYFALLDSPLPPSVEGLQRWLESAWKADIYAAMTSRGIPVNLVDFDFAKGGSSPLIKWILEYFTQDPPKQATVNDALRSASPIVVTERLPIILQHEGHSRTVVGYERLDKGPINLFMFDPSKYDYLLPAIGALKIILTNKKKKYQILYFPMTDPLTEEERLLRREVTSLKMTN